MLCADLCHTALCYHKQNWNNLYGLREKFFRRIFIIPPPDLASSCPQHWNFSKGARFSNKNFPELAPQKNVSACFSPDHYTVPVLSLETLIMIQIMRLYFRHIWSMIARSIHDCWQVRTNKCVRTNICKTSVFVFSVRNINIFGRLLPQFTGLLRANTVAAKRDLLTERTGLGKSESVALQEQVWQPNRWRNSKILTWAHGLLDLENR